MTPRILEKDKKTGVAYVFTEDGVELPVIDVAHPAFALELGEADLAELLQRFLHEEEQRRKIPAFLRRQFFKMGARQSVILRGLADASGTFLSGMNTYVFKLGPDNLGRAYASDLDRTIAASLSGVAVRLRLQDMAWLLADGLADTLQARPEAALHLLNIGGGPAIDSVNALIVLQRREPRLLAGRKVFVHVLDLHHEAPRFGARALAALLDAGAPLEGLDVSFDHVTYNWRVTETLRDLLARLDRDGDVIAVSSEGGLFEYGSDEEILTNLTVLSCDLAEGTVFAGSVTRADGPGRHLHASVGIPLQPRTLEEFKSLAAQGGWAVAEARVRPFSYNVLMKLGKTAVSKQQGR